MNDDLITILTKMYFTAISDLISGDYDYEQMTELAGALRVCMEQGFQAMLLQQKATG